MTQPRRRNISQQSDMIYDVQTFGIIIDTRELFIGNLDNDEDFITHKTANNFIRNLQILNSLSDKPILVHMISCGGIWDYGIAIYDAISTSPSDITVLAHAHARSMSSIIPQAAKWRVIMPNACFLIHNGTLEFSEKNWQSIVSEVEWSKKESEKMLDIYINKCKNGQFFKRNGMDEKTIRKFLKTKMAQKQEFYLTARESVDYGFMDAVFGDPEFENYDNLRESE